MIQTPSKILGPNGQPLMTTAPGKLPPPVVSEMQSPMDFLRMKRRLGTDFSSFRPGQSTPESVDVANRTYGQMARDFDAAVPGGAGLNQRIQSLIPVTERGSNVAINTPSKLRTAARIGGAVGGGLFGFHEAGIPGAIAGTVLPEIVSSPTVQMGTARSLNAIGKALKSNPAKQASRIGVLAKKKENQ